MLVYWIVEYIKITDKMQKNITDRWTSTKLNCDINTECQSLHREKQASSRNISHSDLNSDNFIEAKKDICSSSNSFTQLQYTKATDKYKEYKKN